LQSIYDKYARVYSGKLIAAAIKSWKEGDFESAEYNFQKSRDGFQRAKNPTEWNALEAWRIAAEKKIAGQTGENKNESENEQG